MLSCLYADRSSFFVQLNLDIAIGLSTEAKWSKLRDSCCIERIEFQVLLFRSFQKSASSEHGIHHSLKYELMIGIGTVVVWRSVQNTGYCKYQSEGKLMLEYRGWIDGRWKSIVLSVQDLCYKNLLQRNHICDDWNAIICW